MGESGAYGKFGRPIAGWIVVFAIACVGCEVGPKSGIGLRLPNGDIEMGRQAFHNRGCDRCHAVSGEAGHTEEAPSEMFVVLGGRVAHIETHGELVTSIINPSHGYSHRYPIEAVSEHGESKMKPINEQLTVAELIDLTAFLQSKYELELNQIYTP